MEMISYRKDKGHRYKSLEDKYSNNPDFKLVYSKIQNNDEFSCTCFAI